MSLRAMLERRAAIAAELRSLNEQPGGQDGDLSPEQRTRWDALKGELDALESRISRQSVIDEAERRASTAPVAGTGDRHLDSELRSFSLVRAIQSHLPNFHGDAGRERELSQEIARRAGRPFQGMAVPMAVFEQRVVTTTSPGAGPGSNLIATDYRGDQYIDLLRNALVVRRLGARVLSGLVGNVAIPRLKDDADAAWVAENTAIPMSDMAFGQVSMTPKHVGARAEFSRNMLLQSSPDIESLVRADFAAVLAAEVDRAAINGSGTGAEPTGILRTSGIGSVAVGTNGGAITYDLVADLQGAVDDANVGTDSRAFVSNSKVRRAVAKLKTTDGNPLGLATVFQGMPQAWTNAVPSNGTKGTGTNLSSLIYGNWSDLLLGYWSEFDLLVNPYESEAFSKGNVQVRGMVTMDVAVRYAESFAAIKDIAA